MELEKIQEFVQQANEFRLSGCKVNYDYSLLTTSSINSYKLNLFGMTSSPEFQLNKDNLSGLGHFFLQVKRFDMIYQSKVWDTNPGKFIIIGFIDEVTEDILDTLKKWENCENPKFGFFLIVFKKELVLQKFEKIVVKKGKKQVKENFQVNELPWVSVVYESYEVFRGKLEKFYLPDWERFSEKYSVIETLSFFVDYNEIVVYHSIKKKEKVIDLSGIVVIDFFDESCQDVYLDEQHFDKNLKYYKVYAGVENQYFKFTLENLGLQHGTAEKLFLIDCPCTFIFCNQKLMWRGNKFFEDFSSLLSFYTDGSHYSVPNTTEEALLHSFAELKDSIFQEDLNILIDIKLEVLVYLSSWEVQQKKFRSRLIMCLEDESEKTKVEKIHDKLKTVLPNLNLELTQRQNLFSTALEQPINNSVKTKKKQKKQAETEKMNALIESLRSQISQLENNLVEKNEIIDKQSSVIRELKSSNLGKLHIRVDKMLEEKIKTELELEEKNRLIRELGQKINNLKNQIEYNDSLSEKRDGQLNNLIHKIKNQELEISKLTSEVNKKSKNLVVLQGEITELRPSKEALHTVEKQSKMIEELKKHIKDRENEILILKDIIKSSHFSPESSVWSPSKLPKIKENRSGKILASGRMKSNSISKSINSKKLKRYEVDDNTDQEESKTLEIEKQRLEQLENERLEQLENERLEQLERERLEQLEKERLAELERLEIEKQNEERENAKMEEEEELCKEFYKEIKRREEELRAEMELKKKQDELKKKPNVNAKGKIAAKTGAKTVKKK